MLKQRIAGLLNERRSGFSMPQAFYVDEEIFQADLEAVFASDWLFACSVAEIKRPGDYVTMEIGRDSVVILRDRDGEVKAYFNTCRHRGSRICLHESGRANRLVCPYHQWVYELDGRLINARQMPADFDKSGYSLVPVHVEVICGMVYVSVAENPPSFARFRDTVTPYIAPHQPDRTKVAFSSTIIEEANWKLVIENNRECYHCAGNHPALLVTLVEFALPDHPAANATFKNLMDTSTARWDRLGLPHKPADGGIEFRCIRLPFNEDCVSFTRDGAPACNKLLADFTEPDLGSVRMFRVPNNWNHFLADHIIHFRVLPLGPNRTAVKTTWLVHEDAVEGVDYDIKRLTEVWTETNDEDRILAEHNHQGIQSRAYRPGPFAPSEFMLKNFAEWYYGKMSDYVHGPAHRIAAE
ncbi:Rieske 2Fe-2S family protein [Angulomicrobium tetraedrale]|uniref:Rieske 2Fe-2S family protein n=1 Tax=Ancylobacter tetraedralis TaxID=217068 RepID=A0A839Z5R7_9HYPH|nr:aromatic ring-hydroxylating dioxygenase subunit alpha [Ancylobacter tetraedralis]MBB3770363.1 Rieske 2Fe-2S family protein [Ancylobacter tetraedralis]